MNVFDQIVRFLDRTEVSFVTLIAKVIPLLVPIIPAYVGFSHVTNKVSGLGFDPFFGWIYGAVIEGLGYAAIYKAVQFYEHNRKYTSEKNQAPLQVAVAIYVVYLLVTLIVNVVLDWKSGVVGYKVLALGLISLLSVPAGLLMSISAIHTERTNEREKATEQARVDRIAKRKENEHGGVRPTNARSSSRATLRGNLPAPAPTNEHIEQNGDRPFGFAADPKRLKLFAYIDQLESDGQVVPGPSELGRRLGMSKGYISDELRRVGR